MAPTLTQRLRIQQALVALVNGREFPYVSYESSGAPAQVDPDENTVTPLTPILCNEIESAFGDDENNGRQIAQVRSAWQFALRMKFNREVLLELFEDSVMDNPPTIAKDDALGLPFVRLRIVSQRVEHPVQQQGASGTIVEYIFEAEEGRR